MIKILLVLLFSVMVAVACDSAPNTNQNSSEADKALESAQQVKSVKSVAKPAPVPDVKPVETKPKPELKSVQKNKQVAAIKSMSGQQVYYQSCQNCHATGAAGSPKLGDVANWKKRIEKGIDVLYQSAIKGIPSTAMLPRGTCTKCSDEELKAAVDFMVSAVN